MVVEVEEPIFVDWAPNINMLSGAAGDGNKDGRTMGEIEDEVSSFAGIGISTDKGPSGSTVYAEELAFEDKPESSECGAKDLCMPVCFSGIISVTSSSPTVSAASTSPYAR